MFDQPKTKTLQNFLAREAAGLNRIVGLSIEPDGVFIYTDSSLWCDDAGAGTFRGDSETQAIARFRDQVQPAGEVYDDEEVYQVCPACEYSTGPDGYLGRLLDVLHVRCRACGLIYHVK